MPEGTDTFTTHYGEYMIHPVELPLQCSCPQFDVVVRLSKNKASVTPFQYVVLHPTAPSSSEDFTALVGRCICKDTACLTLHKIPKDIFEKGGATLKLWNFETALSIFSGRSWWPGREVSINTFVPVPIVPIKI